MDIQGRGREEIAVGLDEELGNRTVRHGAWRWPTTHGFCVTMRGGDDGLRI
uniref:Uncharacterized protein n=1 Tax=Arundo donax TaxID=35708 RepID=A0A0A9C478_ARUDO